MPRYLPTLPNILLAVTTVMASFSIAVAVKADTVTARCDVYPKGEDRATSSGLCSFSQRQGVVGIQLKNGKRYDLVPAGNKLDNYRDQNSRAAYRESGLGNKGQIYRLANESIFVYWDTAPYKTGKTSGNQSNTDNTAAVSQPDAGTTVSRLSDLIGANAGQAENAIKQRGYRFVKSSPSGNAVYSQWLEGKTNYCVTIQTQDGRYQSIVYAGGSADCAK
jgi:hypothetical protein